LLHLVGSSVLLYLIDDARTNTNQGTLMFCTVFRKILRHQISRNSELFRADGRTVR